MKIIAMTNKKGGVGKTTTALSTAAYLGQSGFSVLAIDMDAQGNFSQASGAKRDEAGTFDFLRGDPPENCIQKMAKYDLLAADARLSRADKEFDQIGSEHLLEKALKRLKGYDYVILDTSPAMNVLTLNAFTAADSLLVPLQCEYYAMEGLADLTTSVKLANRRLNKNLYIEGILLTMYDKRLSFSSQVAEELRKYFGDRVYDTVIPRNVRLAEAPSHGKPVTAYDSSSKGAKAYRAAAAEFLERQG